MAGTRSVYRIARTMLLALAALLAVGAVASILLSVRAIDQAKSAAVDQARSIVENSLPIVLSPSDVNSEATDVEADQITVKITPVVLDPTTYDDIAIWSTDGTIVYATDSSLIGQRPEEARTAVTDATTHGTVSWDQRDGSFSVLVPLRLRSDAPIAAAVQLARPDGPIAAAGRPWQFAAVFMAISAVVAFVFLYKVMRLSASAATMSNFVPTSARAAAAMAAMPPVQRPMELPAPGLREEGDARRKAEERAAAAEQRLSVIQEQYRKTLEQLHVTQRAIQERPLPGAPDPELEGRLLKAEGQARLLEGQLKAMGIERDKLARHIAEQAKNRPDAEIDHRARQVEQEAIGLRAELEGAQTELSVTRRELDALKAQAARAQEMHDDLDAAHVEALHTRETLESVQAELARANNEVEEARNEIRGLRTEEQRAAVLGEELRAARAELDSLKASHRADLVEREADLEERVRRTREEFQAQTLELESQAKRQLAEREATMTKEAASREAALTAEAAQREATLRAEAADREAELQHRLAEREATLQEEMAEQAASLESRMRKREEELTSEIARSAAGSDAATTELRETRTKLETALADLQASRDEIAAATHDGSSRHEQLAKAKEELMRSRTEIETLQQELAEASRLRERAEREQELAAREREEIRLELAAASAEIQAELGRGVELTERADRFEKELRAARGEAAQATEDLQRVAAERDGLSRTVAEAEASHAAELAAAAAETRTDPDMERVLRVSQERLASQTEKLIEVEERAHSAERQFAETIVRLEEVEAELRHLHMEKALHDLQTSSEPAAAAGATPESRAEAVEPLEDRRASTPFTRELSLDAKKTLSHIMGLTQVMKYKKDSKDQAQLIKQLTAAARRLDHTVADLTEADALAHGVVDLTIKRTDLEALVKRVVEESGVGLDHDVRVDSQSLVVAVDALRVEQVLAGLLRASGDRTPPGKAITVRLAHLDGGALISVEDPEPSSDGSLSPVVHRFVEMQGGWTRIESRDGGGSVFRVFLPDGGPSGETPAEPPPLDAAAEPGQEASPTGGTLQIVVREPPHGDEASGENWRNPEEQLLVQELHRLHAED
jgi:signal transduction histidine kinase